MSTYRFYAYSNCDTCRKARRFLQEHRFVFEEIAIRETAPTETELRTVLATMGVPVSRLFNTAGTTYRAMKLKDKLPSLGIDDTLALLQTDGNLVKRPLLVRCDGDWAWAGFDAGAWSESRMP